MTYTSGMNFLWQRDGIDFPLYDSGLILMMNFDKISSLGETTSIARDVSQYYQTGTINGSVTWRTNGVGDNGKR